jgi:hypothetical protein
MSRFREGDYEGEPEEILAQGRWEHNARRALKGKRGRKALADLREALLALPEPRLIEGALCITADVDAVLPEITDEEIAVSAAKSAAWRAESGLPPVTAEDARHGARWMREERTEARERYAALVAAQGCGVCAVGAYLWHQKVTAGMDPAEAFGSLPHVFDDGSDELSETATLGQQAGLAYTLAWELAYRNDETYDRMTPEERWTAFLAWIDGELAEQSQPAA